MNGSLDELRRAARNYAAAENRYHAVVANADGPHNGTRQAKTELDAAHRALVRAGDVHAARKTEGIVDLIRSGHTHLTAKRVLEMRAKGDGKPRNKSALPVFVPGKKKNRVFNLKGKKRKAK